MSNIESVSDVKAAVERAKREIYRAEQAIQDMASLCAGRLKSSDVSPRTLEMLKRELANFNIHTGRWKK